MAPSGDLVKANNDLNPRTEKLEFFGVPGKSTDNRVFDRELQNKRAAFS